MPTIPAAPSLPLPDIRPTLPLWPDAGRLLGLGRSATYNAAATGEIPVLRIGGKILVPTAALRRLVGVDQ